MADAFHRASLLFRLFLHCVRMNTIQRANNWIRARPNKKNKVGYVKGSYFPEGDAFFDMGNLVIGTEKCEIFSAHPQSEEVYFVPNAKETAGKTFPKKKNGGIFGKSNVSPSERRGWDEDIKGKDKKRRQSRTLRFFGSRSTKASSIKNDFNKPYYNNNLNTSSTPSPLISKEIQ